MVFAQTTEENLVKFEQEHQVLQNTVQQKLAQLEVEYEKELVQITQNYKLELGKLQTAYEVKKQKDASTKEKYLKEQKLSRE